MGFSLEDETATSLLTPYLGGKATCRYYQDATTRAAFEKIIKCEKEGEPKRMLLTIATWADKTFDTFDGADDL